MHFISSLVALSVPLLVSAAPARVYGVGKRADSDILVLKFADVLEQLESQFYTSAINKFQAQDFTVAGFASPNIAVEQAKVMQFDEQTHSTALQAALKSFGEEPLTSCTFNFDSVLTDVASTFAAARVVENTGVAAYLGGATLITDPVLLDAAASILSVEARHSSILNVLNAGGAIPSAFDIPMTPSEILAIASPFIGGSCDLGIPANPTLTITNTEKVGPGTTLQFQSSALNGSMSEDQLFCNMMVGGAPISISLPMAQCVVPDGIDGPVAIWITSDSQPLINNVRDRATTQQVAGPTIAFIDTVTETLGSMVKAAAGSETTTTQTLDPGQASSLIASASATAASPESTGASASGGSSFIGSAGSINSATGPTVDNAIDVIGWSNLPSSS